MCGRRGARPSASREVHVWTPRNLSYLANHFTRRTGQEILPLYTCTSREVCRCWLILKKKQEPIFFCLRVNLHLSCQYAVKENSSEYTYSFYMFGLLPAHITCSHYCFVLGRAGRGRRGRNKGIGVGQEKLTCQRSIHGYSPFSLIEVASMFMCFFPR